VSPSSLSSFSLIGNGVLLPFFVFFSPLLVLIDRFLASMRVPVLNTKEAPPKSAFSVIYCGGGGVCE
jgi:hypothetical protein